LGFKQLADNKVIPIRRQVQHEWNQIALRIKLNVRKMQSSSCQTKEENPKFGRKLPNWFNPKWRKGQNKKVDGHNPHNYLNER
jgi:hypothetical protein